MLLPVALELLAIHHGYIVDLLVSRLVLEEFEHVVDHCLGFVELPLRQELLGFHQFRPLVRASPGFETLEREIHLRRDHAACRRLLHRAANDTAMTATPDKTAYKIGRIDLKHEWSTTEWLDIDLTSCALFDW